MKRTLLWKRARRGSQYIKLLHVVEGVGHLVRIRYVLPQHMYYTVLPKRNPSKHFFYKLTK